MNPKDGSLFRGKGKAKGDSKMCLKAVSSAADDLPP